jgi:hypothetical protein
MDGRGTWILPGGLCTRQARALSGRVWDAYSSLIHG